MLYQTNSIDFFRDVGGGESNIKKGKICNILVLAILKL